MRRRLRILLVLVAAYLLVAYLILPSLWRHYEHQPALEKSPKYTVTDAGIQGDPLNVGLVGSREEVLFAFASAGWRVPAALGLRSDIGIAESVVADRPDPTAPVSQLFLFGRPEDLAFEKEVGHSADERNHVRFWRDDSLGTGTRPFWIGAASFDRGVGISHRTGQITHHIAPDIDAERDLVMEDLSDARQLVRRYQVTGIGPTLNGHNGGGDRYYTDGELDVGVLIEGEQRRLHGPEVLPNPEGVQLKERLWKWIEPWLRE
ncbi:MAG TPA: LssY C-terminal domain-containing protein [Myxococcota bacterium]|nr:LssY C-terminal domain-containing protein [Myxococcota bacterium]